MSDGNRDESLIGVGVPCEWEMPVSFSTGETGDSVRGTTSNRMTMKLLAESSGRGQ